MFCFSPECKKKPTLVCGCRLPTTLACTEHLQTHINSNTSSTHSFRSLSKSVPADLKPEAITLLKTSLNILKSQKRSLPAICSNFFTLIEEKSRVLSARISLCKSLIIKILMKSKAKITYRDKFDTSDELKLVDLENEITKKYTASNLGIAKCLKDLEKIDLEVKETVDTSKMLYFFKSESKTLVEFDTVGLRYISYEIKVDENQGDSAVVNLGQGRLFIAGGWDQAAFDSVYLFDTTGKDPVKLNNGRIRSATAPAKFNNKIYYFGGYSDRSLSNADYFDLATMNWIEVASMPSTSFYITTVICDNSVMIAGDKNLLLMYRTQRNVYEAAGKIVNNRFSILIKYADKILLITNANMYVGSVRNAGVWQGHKKVSNFNHITCVPVVKGKLAYFSDYDSKIYEVNMETNEMRHIATGSA